jgi:hypothetical protein
MIGHPVRADRLEAPLRLVGGEAGRGIGLQPGQDLRELQGMPGRRDRHG